MCVCVCVCVRVCNQHVSSVVSYVIVELRAVCVCNEHVSSVVFYVIVELRERVCVCVCVISMYPVLCFMLLWS